MSTTTLQADLRQREYVAWMRNPRAGVAAKWRAVAGADSYAEAAIAADDYLASASDVPQYVEVYVGRRGTRPPI